MFKGFIAAVAFLAILVFMPTIASACQQNTVCVKAASKKKPPKKPTKPTPPAAPPLVDVNSLGVSPAWTNFVASLSLTNSPILTTEGKASTIGGSPYNKTKTFEAMANYLDTLEGQVKKQTKYSDATTKKVKANIEGKLQNNLELIIKRKSTDLENIDALAYERLDAMLWSLEDDYAAIVGAIYGAAETQKEDSRAIFKTQKAQIVKAFATKIKRAKTRAIKRKLILAQKAQIGKALAEHQTRIEAIDTEIEAKEIAVGEEYDKNSAAAEAVAAAERNKAVADLNARVSNEIYSRSLKKYGFQKALSYLSRGRSGPIQGGIDPAAEGNKEVKTPADKKNASDKRKAKKAAKAKTRAIARARRAN